MPENKFYSNRRKLARKKAKDLPNLNLSSEADVFISESLTPFKKKLYDVNKVKTKLKWKDFLLGRTRIIHLFSIDCEEDLVKFKLEHASHRSSLDTSGENFTK